MSKKNIYSFSKFRKQAGEEEHSKTALQGEVEKAFDRIDPVMLEFSKFVDAGPVSENEVSLIIAAVLAGLNIPEEDVRFIISKALSLRDILLAEGAAP